MAVKLFSDAYLAHLITRMGRYFKDCLFNSTGTTLNFEMLSPTGTLPHYKSFGLPQRQELYIFVEDLDRNFLLRSDLVKFCAYVSFNIKL